MALLTLSERLCTSAARLLFEPEPPLAGVGFLIPTDSSSMSYI